MLVTLDETNRIVSIEGDPENPATGGHVCVKGLSYARRVTSADRLLRPLRRRATGVGFEPIAWDDAVGEICDRLTQVRERYGPEAAPLLRRVRVARGTGRAGDGVLGANSAGAPPPSATCAGRQVSKRRD